MSRRFRLQTLQRLRENAEQEATAELGRRRHAVHDAEMTLQLLRESVTACLPPPRATPDQVSAVSWQREALRDKADAAALEVSRRRTDLVAATEQWHRRRAELRAVQNLHERHLRVLAEQDARREQRLTDEAAATVLRMPGPARSGGMTHDPQGGVL